MTDVTAIAASGLQSSARAFESYAAAVVQDGLTAPSPPAPQAITYQPVTTAPSLALAPDMPTAMVGAMEAANSFRANLAVFRTGARMFRALLDIVA